MPSYELSLQVVPHDGQVSCQLSWVDGHAPSGTVDFMILYFRQGSKTIKSVSSQTTSVDVNTLTNGQTYYFKAIAYQGGFSDAHKLSESSLVSSVPSTVPQAPQNLQGIVST